MRVAMYDWRTRGELYSFTAENSAFAYDGQVHGDLIVFADIDEHDEDGAA